MTLQPETPMDAGIEERAPDRSHLEGAHLLADQSREHLEAAGFNATEILEWAESYTAYSGTGDVEDFLEWIAAQECGSKPDAAPTDTRGG